MTYQRITSRDVALGRVPPRTGANGVTTPPGLLINHLALEEFQQRRREADAPPISREEALKHYEPDEVEEYFGEEENPMPKFSKCHGGNCPSRFTCDRFTAPADEHQNYSDFSQHLGGKQRCDWFIKVVPAAPAEQPEAAHG